MRLASDSAKAGVAAAVDLSTLEPTAVGDHFAAGLAADPALGHLSRRRTYSKLPAAGNSAKGLGFRV